MLLEEYETREIIDKIEVISVFNHKEADCYGAAKVIMHIPAPQKALGAYVEHVRPELLSGRREPLKTDQDTVFLKQVWWATGDRLRGHCVDSALSG